MVPTILFRGACYLTVRRPGACHPEQSARPRFSDSLHLRVRRARSEGPAVRPRLERCPGLVILSEYPRIYGREVKGPLHSHPT